MHIIVRFLSINRHEEVEFNLFAPEDVQAEDRQPLFEQFWDSRAPSIGEAGGVGWAETLRLKQKMTYNEENLGECVNIDS